MTSYAEALAAAKCTPQLGADGVRITPNTYVFTSALDRVYVLEVAHCLDEIAPGRFVPWHLIRRADGRTTTAPNMALWSRHPITQVRP